MFLSVVPPDVLNGKPCAGCTSFSVLTTPTLTPSTPPPPSTLLHDQNGLLVLARCRASHRSFCCSEWRCFEKPSCKALVLTPASGFQPSTCPAVQPDPSPFSVCAALIGGYLWGTCWGGNGGRGERGVWGVGGWKRRIIRLRFGLSTFWQSINLWGRSVPASSTFTSTSTSASAERPWPKPSTRIRKCWEKNKWRGGVWEMKEISWNCTTAQHSTGSQHWDLLIQDGRWECIDLGGLFCVWSLNVGTEAKHTYTHTHTQTTNNFEGTNPKWLETIASWEKKKRMSVQVVNETFRKKSRKTGHEIDGKIYRERYVIR